MSKNIHTNFELYSEQNSISIFEILLILSKRIKVLILLPLLSIISSIIYALFIAEASFIAPAKIINSSLQTQSSPMVGIASRLGLDLESNKQQGLGFIYEDILKSRDFAKKMLSKKFDSNMLGNQKSLMQILNKDLNEIELNNPKVKSKTITSFIRNINYNGKAENGVVELSVTVSEPKLARDITQSMIEELDLYQKNHNKGNAIETRIFIQSRIDKTEIELKDKEEILKDFRDRNRRIQNSPKLLLEQERLSREVMVLNGVFTNLKQQLENVKIDEVKESDYVLVIDSPEIPVQKSGPNRQKIVLLSAIISVVVSILFVFLTESYKSVTKTNKSQIKQLKKNISLQVGKIK